jgi:hypothetical protein
LKDGGTNQMHLQQFINYLKQLKQQLNHDDYIKLLSSMSLLCNIEINGTNETEPERKELE